MERYLLKRTVMALLVLAGTSLATYGMIFLTPGDPAETVLREQLEGHPSDEQVAEFRAEHGLDDPIPVQYLNWLANGMRGDLGESYYHDRTVSELIADRLPATLALAGTSLAVALLVAVPAGVITAVHRDTPLDYLSQFGALAGVSVPNFWLGYLLIIVFSLELGLFPVSGSGLSGLVLPAVALGTGLAAIITRLLRASLLETLDAAYVRTARSKGLRERVVVYRHALRSALIPVVTVVGLQLGYLLNGAVIIEVVFDRPGLGALLVDSVFARDYPVVQGVVLLTAALFVFTNTLVDLSYRWLDPRVELEGHA